MASGTASAWRSAKVKTGSAAFMAVMLMRPLPWIESGFFG
jgi:hypothetical protein